MLDYGYDEEREAALYQESMSQGEYMSAALAQYAAAHGGLDPARAWVLTPFDTWERNPHYQGPPVRHPEDDYPEDDDDAPVEPAAFVASDTIPANWIVPADTDDEIPF